MQQLRRVSFSDSALTEEHFYPKYIYHDYDAVNDEAEGTDDGSNKNSGLSQRIHPSLLPSHETDRYSPSKIPPMKSSTLGQFTPSTMNNYSDMMTSSYSYSNKSSSPSSKKQVEEEPMYNGGPVNNDKTNDFYSALNADTAALLW